MVGAPLAAPFPLHIIMFPSFPRKRESIAYNEVVMKVIAKTLFVLLGLYLTLGGLLMLMCNSDRELLLYGYIWLFFGITILYKCRILHWALDSKWLRMTYVIGSILAIFFIHYTPLCIGKLVQHHFIAERKCPEIIGAEAMHPELLRLVREKMGRDQSSDSFPKFSSETIELGWRELRTLHPIGLGFYFDARDMRHIPYILSWNTNGEFGLTKSEESHANELSAKERELVK